MTDTNVVIIGAGLAGLGAAAACRDSGRAAVVLEASGRVGGRAWTDYPAAFGGVWFDMGAIWFHNAEHNPLVPLARAAGDTLLRSDEIRQERTFIGNRMANEVELTAFADAWPRYEAAADAILATKDDVSLAEVTRQLPDDPWAATVEAWEGPVICAADADKFSARDWRRNALNGGNLLPDGGIGAFAQRRLTTGLDIRLHSPVTRVRWGRPGGAVTVETASGSITAKACIVTVSTGVLASGALRFDPALPVRTTEAIHAPADGVGDEGRPARDRARPSGLAAALFVGPHPRAAG